MSAPRRWVIAGGGTGGHVTPALALAERIAARGDEVTVIGGERGLETRLVPAAGFALVALRARPIAGQGALGRLRAAPAIARGCADAWRALGRVSAEIVVSVGGYASVPAVVAAALRRIPVALIEPNAIAGRANRAAARFAAHVFVHFEAAADAFPRARAGGHLSAPGIPLRRALVEAFAGRPPRRTPERPLRLLVFGGSQGARQINEAMMDAAPGLDRDALVVFHQTGEADRERVAAAYAAAGLDATVVAFEPDMVQRYLWADLALCRSGALTTAELALAGLPSLLVPYPYAADDHQAANAEVLAAAGAARALDSKQLDGGVLVRTLEAIQSAPETLVAMGEAAAKLARPDAAEQVIDACDALLASRGGG